MKVWDSTQALVRELARVSGWAISLPTASELIKAPSLTYSREQITESLAKDRCAVVSLFLSPAGQCVRLVQRDAMRIYCWVEFTIAGDGPRGRLQIAANAHPKQVDVAFGDLDLGAALCAAVEYTRSPKLRKRLILDWPKPTK